MNRVAIFEGLNSSQIELLKPLFAFFYCPAGTFIFRQGERAEFLYLVIHGKVDVSFKPYDGVPITIAHVNKSGLFGWSAVVGSDNYTSSAVAIENVEAIRVYGIQLHKFCQEHPEAGKDILERLADGASFHRKDAHRQVQSILSQEMIEKFRSV